MLSKRLGRSPEDIIKLDANENPYGPPPEVAEALGNMAFPHIYPDPECRALRGKLAELNSTPEENILVRATNLLLTTATHIFDFILGCCESALSSQLAFASASARDRYEA